MNKTFEEVYFERMSFIHVIQACLQIIRMVWLIMPPFSCLQISESNFLDVYFKALENLQDPLIKKYFLNVIYALAKNSFENTIYLSKVTTA